MANERLISGVIIQELPDVLVVFAATKTAGNSVFLAHANPSLIPMRKSVLARKSARSADVERAVTERRSKEKVFGCLGCMR